LIINIYLKRGFTIYDWHGFAFFKNMRSIFVLIFIVCFSSFHLSAQVHKDSVKIAGYRLPFIIEGTDTIPVVNLPIITIEDLSNPEYLKNLQAYYRLRYNVIKVYPYARLAAVKLQEMDMAMKRLSSDRERRKYRKGTEEQLRKDFEDQIKKLSINQGNILIKLIDRETGHTSYELIKELKGSFNAFFSQGVAKLFKHNLKDSYDPEGDDKTIEQIVRQIETGQITF